MTVHERHHDEVVAARMTMPGDSHERAPAIHPAVRQFTLACPRCVSVLQIEDSGTVTCPADGEQFEQETGIGRFLLPDRQAYFAPFIADYEAIRRAEGRGSSDPVYYRSLPERDLTSRFTEDWRIRARSYRALVSHVVHPLERRARRPLKIMDLGAGNCWLSNRLAHRGHHVAAVDLVDNGFDGLGCWTFYESVFYPAQAEFDHLPFASDQFDLVIFNGSIHYATDYIKTLTEALRVTAPEGRIAVIDSPLYKDESSGHQMVREREVQFEQSYGFPSNRLPSEGFLTYHRLTELAVNLGIQWRLQRVWYGLRWELRPLRARLRGRREPARFMLISGVRPQNRVNKADGLARKGLRKLARIALGVRYRLTQRHRHRRLTLEHVAGHPILVLPDVFNPALFRSGTFLAESLSEALLPPGSSVLDMGTGSGACAIAAARWAGEVVAVDINVEAVRCAGINARLNGVEDRMGVRHGDLFEPIGDERFDVVLFNPPYYRGAPADDYDHAWRSVDTVERFAEGLENHLTECGAAYVVLSSDGVSSAFLESFRRNHLLIELVRQRDLINETLTIYRLHPDRG